MAVCSPSSSLCSSSALTRPRPQQSYSEYGALQALTMTSDQTDSLTRTSEILFRAHSLSSPPCLFHTVTSSCASSLWLCWLATSCSTKRSTYSRPWLCPLPPRSCPPLPTPHLAARDPYPPSDGHQGATKERLSNCLLNKWRSSWFFLWTGRGMMFVWLKGGFMWF